MRIEGWERRLYEEIDSTGPFEWGTNDCCMFVVRVAEALTGEDHGKAYRGYKTARGAKARLLKHGGVEAIATIEFGEPKSHLYAKRGDIVSVKTGEEIALGICVGDKIAVVSEDGLLMLPIRDGINAWSV